MAVRTYRNFFSFFIFSAATLAFGNSPDLSPKTRDLIDRFFSPPQFADVQLSPGGSHLAFFKEVQGQLILATYNFKTARLALTDPDLGQEVASFYWVGPDQILFEYIQRSVPDHPQTRGVAEAPIHPENFENIYLGHWVVDADLTHLERVPDVGPIYEMVDPLPQDPTSVLLATQAYDKFYSPLYRFDPIRNTVKLIEENPGRVYRWITDVAGHVRLAEIAEKDGENSFIYRENEKSAWQPLSVPAHTQFITFDQSGRYLLLSHPDQTGRFVMQPYDLGAHKFANQIIADPVYDVIPDAVRDPRTGVARGLVYETEKSKFIWFDPQVEKLQAKLAPALAGATVVPLGITSTGDIFLSATADVSPDKYYLFNPKTGQLTLVLNQHPKVEGLALSPMKPVTFKAADGTNLHGYLTLPAGHVEGKLPPLIALVHGGPMVRDTWGYDSEVQYFAALGYAVLQVNYRGSSGYGGGYALDNIVEVGVQSVEDIADSLRWAVAQGIADPKRLVVYGGSYGGYIALGMATRHPDLPACVVGFAGVYDWEFMERGDFDGHYQDYFRWRTDYYPELKQNAERYRAISPAHQASAVKAPVLLLHGRKDRRVDIAQSELMASALRKAGKSVEIVKDAEGVHGLPDEKLRRNYYERITAFILKYAPPDQLP
jgi:dipeptidyl aminopeptidase/acylaminoacyl peptidase